MTLAILLTYLYAGDAVQLDATTAFVTLALVNMVSSPLTMMGAGLAYVIQAFVSFQRMSQFLNEGEIDFDAQFDKLPSNSGSLFEWSSYFVTKALKLNSKSPRLNDNYAHFSSK